MADRICSVDCCRKPVTARGWCAAHYQRWWTWGDPLGSAPRTPVDVRFWDQVERPSPTECWLWAGALVSDGYGRFYHDGREELAHRYALRTRYPDRWDESLFVLHSCDVPRCVNPAHLRQGTHADNMADMVARGRSRGPGLGGAANPAARVAPRHVADIRRRYAAGGITQKALGAEYGLSQQAVSAIVTGATWGEGW